ncbi:hypothetical protein [Succiniclasticum ruminis]|uniref:Uncharacterized protein n=1 Tax=Succiniclasticum ruminis DSM 9236 TaxID=1123323 RepID=A0A1I2DUN8_9FIRM|nr:hypothetical protein [Succiniclasticum ruminis]SFE83650.1 hypothetical protein SAMN05216245_12326 [Succiniclasticum ruminis DSM 9236]
MKFLLETIFGLVFFAIFIWALPTIIGIFSLGLVLYFVFTLATGHSDDSAGKRHRTDTQYEAKTRTAEQTTHYTNTSHSGYRHYEDDDYESRYNSYYGDCGNDDTPPDDDIHFRGTGAPFL